MNYFRKKDGRNDLYFSISFKLHCRQGFRPKYCFLSVNAFNSKMIRPLIKCLYHVQNEKHVIAIFVYNLINLKVEICFFFLVRFTIIHYVSKVSIVIKLITFVNKINGNCDCNEKKSNVIVIKMQYIS